MLKESDLPQIDSEFMHDVHKKEVVLINNIISSFENNKELEKNLDELLTHTISHFGGEDELMIESGFPIFDFHNMEHTKGINELKTKISEYKESKDLTSLKQYIEVDLIEWTINHINTMDKITATFLETGMMSCGD